MSNWLKFGEPCPICGSHKIFLTDVKGGNYNYEITTKCDSCGTSNHELSLLKNKMELINGDM